MMFFSSIFLVFKFFSKKFMSLLFLELSFLSLVVLFLSNSYCSFSHNPYFSSLILLVFMVLDSVFALCLLVFSSRNSTIFSNLI